MRLIFKINSLWGIQFMSEYKRMHFTKNIRIIMYELSKHVHFTLILSTPALFLAKYKSFF